VKLDKKFWEIMSKARQVNGTADVNKYINSIGK